MSIQPINHSKQRGFTLVEVIVVAVIVAILAGVSVPLYLGYINSSRTNQATNAAGSAASFVNACRNSGSTITLGTTASGNDSTGTLTCVNTNNTANNTTLRVPPDITLTFDATANTVIAHHDQSPAAPEGNSAPFSFAAEPQQ